MPRSSHAEAERFVYDRDPEFNLSNLRPHAEKIPAFCWSAASIGARLLPEVQTLPCGVVGPKIIRIPRTSSRR
jgi:hypothetical protein